MNTFKLVVSSPDGDKFNGEAVKLDVRSSEGELAIMAGQNPFVTTIVEAPCTVWLNEDTKKTAKSKGGLLTVGSDEVTLLSGTFEFDE